MKDFKKLYENIIKSEWFKKAYHNKSLGDCPFVIDELEESEDERIRKHIIDIIKDNAKSKCIPCDAEIAYLEKQKINTEGDFGRGYDCGYEACLNSHGAEWFKKQKHPNGCFTCDEYKKGYEEGRRNGFTAGYNKAMKEVEQKEQKPIKKMEAYEVRKGTTICGQDYKCKKDYKVGNCWYIKDAIYHCGRDGYLTDQNGVSWSCTPEWFNEYIYTNNEWADKEKNDFVSEQFLQCKLSFDGFKEGEHYWLEYIGDDMYVGRSDNILNQKFHITPRQLYALFTQQLDVIEEKQKEQKPVEIHIDNPNIEKFDPDVKITTSDSSADGDELPYVFKSYDIGYRDGKRDAEQKPEEWSEEDEKTINNACCWIAEYAGYLMDKNYSKASMLMSLTDKLKSLCLQPHTVSIKDAIKFGNLEYERGVKDGIQHSENHRWKPSEEQMEALNVLNCHGGLSYVGQQNQLISLYNDLKKLK